MIHRRSRAAGASRFILRLCAAGCFVAAVALFTVMAWLRGGPDAASAFASGKDALPALAVTEIAPGVYVSQGRYETASPGNRGRISNLSFVVGSDAVAVIDTGGSAEVGRALKAAISGITSLPVRYVVNTHMHPDHVFGNAAFYGDGVEFAGHHKLPRALQARGQHYLRSNRALLGEQAFSGTRIILPTRTVRGSLDLDLGGRVLRLTAHPTAHTDNDLTVLDLETRTFWPGDLLFVRHIPVIDGSLTGWLDVLNGLLARDLARVVPGHGPALLPWPDAVRDQLRYLTALAGAVRRHIGEGRTLAEATKEILAGEKENWLLFDEFHARNVAAAFTELEWE